MAGRGRGVGITNDLLERMTQVLEAFVHNQDGESGEYRGLFAFTRHNPPKFEKKFDLEGAQRWVANVEKTFHSIWGGRGLVEKAREFLSLKQGNMTVGEYAVKFQELMKYWPHYQYEDKEEDLCAQFEHRLRPEIHAAVSVFQLTDLPTLVSKCRIFEANSKGKTVDTRGSG
ncbi:uncharacterized protein LOC113850872 [Abrus precatorius]|uniref:Uncharacterized protein LOC113850872 n=1 Tax=Abrus precatorius TaxID=3816 RepID=A0A8B8K0M5_ABRPR|nr:uncharacterized protein LOC113850872 [Abrus precatorius]